ncbi:hypothetical protein EDD11_004756 [Mortierella claussenii]|nr:hypothetical protein EDD11_004756 [Mortierella claussenii]
MASSASRSSQDTAHAAEELPTLAITACDSYEGQLLALKLADHLEKKYNGDHPSRNLNTPPTPQLLCLMRDASKSGRLITHPICKLIQVSYDDRNALAIALRGVQTMVLVPEIEPQRVDWANSLVDVMTQEKVVRCVVISCIGSDAPEKDQLQRFVTVEDKVRDSIQRWTILREGFPFQALFYWIPMIQDQGTLGMSIKPDVEFAPLDIRNLGDALISVTFPSDLHHNQDQVDIVVSESDHGSDVNDTKPPSDGASTRALAGDISHLAIKDDIERFDGQIYTITGPETITGPKLVDALNRAMEEVKDHNGSEGEPFGEDKKRKPFKPINYKNITRDELRKYLLTLRHKDGSPHSTSYRYNIVGVPGIRTAVRIFQQATEAAFGGRHTHEVSKPNPSEVSNPPAKEEWIKENADSREGEDKDGNKCPCDPEDPPAHHRPQLEAPNDTEVDLILDLLDYINEGRATFQSGDLEKLAGIRGADAKRFCEDYAYSFRYPPDRNGDQLL